MSIALDSPMEALAVHGVLMAVNNVWAWIAFLTAAISFWKIKSSIHFPPHHLSLQLSPPPPPVADQPELPSTSTPTTTPSLTSSKRLTTFCTLENRKSGKFSVYYSQDDGKIDSEEDINGDKMVKDDSWRKDYGEEGWKVVLRMKTSEMAWYNYQDLRVLNGNVVRLWN